VRVSLAVSMSWYSCSNSSLWLGNLTLTPLDTKQFARPSPSPRVSRVCWMTKSELGPLAEFYQF
jgi:hypothetical protein